MKNVMEFLGDIPLRKERLKETMSYEGHTQFLCEDGHYWTQDCSYDWEQQVENKCHVCEKVAVWQNSVDDTNCNSVGIILLKDLQEISPGRRETCNLGHSHEVEYAKYKIPTKEETEKLRRYMDDERDGKWCWLHSEELCKE